MLLIYYHHDVNTEKRIPVEGNYLNTMYPVKLVNFNESNAV